MTDDDSRRYDVGVLVKAIDVIEALVGTNGLGLTELASAAGVSRGSVFRIATTLEGRGWLSKHPDSKKYYIGEQFLALLSRLDSRVDLVSLAQPAMTRLRDQFGETVNLGRLAGGTVEYVHIVESEHGLRMASKPGARDPLHSTAMGKALLARLSDDTVEALFPPDARERRTSRTITTLNGRLAEMERVREAGWAEDAEENEIGSRCIAVAISGIDGNPVAALSISGPTARIDDALAAQIAESLRESAAKLEESLGAGLMQTAVGAL